MGPGPVDVYPRVLRAMSVALQGQFDPQFTAYMTETMALYRQVFRTANHWTFLIDGTARAGIEACLASIAGAGRQDAGADLRALRPSQGGDRPAARRRRRLDRDASGAACSRRARSRPPSGSIGRACWRSATATPPPPCCSRSAEIGALCRKHDVLLYVDCTASLGGNPFEMDAWQIDIASAGLQKCLSGPPGSSPISFSDRVAEVVNAPQACRAGHQDAGDGGGQRPHHPLQLFRSRHADGLLVAEAAQPPHGGGLHALCGARVRPRGAGRGAGGGLCAASGRQRRAARGARGDGARAVRRCRGTAWPT